MYSPFSWTDEEYYNQSLGLALGSLMILKTHAISVLNENGSLSSQVAIVIVVV